MANDAKTDVKDSVEGWTPLNYLCYYGGDSPNHVEAATMLLDKDPALRDIPDNYGNTPLYWAAFSGHYKLCELLLSKGASKDKKNSDGRTPEQEAKYWNHDVVAKFIRDYVS